MKTYKFIDEQGTFVMENPEDTSYLYFPLANEAGVKSSVTPLLGGDSKTSQNTFLLQPVSSEDLHGNRASRNFWFRNGEREPWSATGMSVYQQGKRFTQDREETVLTAGLMWHNVRRFSREQELEAEVLSFVPSGDKQVEIMVVTLRNTGLKTVEVTPTAAIPMYCRSADNIRDHRHVTSLLHRIETTSRGVVVHPTLTFDERGHQKNQMYYYVYGVTEHGKPPVGFYPLVEDFLGEGGSFDRPEAVFRKNGIEPAGKNFAGYEAMGAIRFAETKLTSGQRKSFIICMGYAESKEDIEKTADCYGNAKAVFEAFEETKAYWLKSMTVAFHTNDAKFDNYMYWVSFQPMLRRLFGCSFLPHHDYGKGGRGWRDLWQDCLALLIMDPQEVRGMLLDNFGGVRLDGTNATIIGNSRGEFIADRNNITRVWMDHGVWPLMTTDLYIQMTGDIDILCERLPYFKDKQTGRGEAKDEAWHEADGVKQRTADGTVYTGSVFEHLLLQNITACYDVGEHNEIRLRGADWNDALDMAKERGESVAFTCAYAGNLDTLAKLLRQLKKSRGIAELEVSEAIVKLLDIEKDIFGDIEKKHELLDKFYSELCPTFSGKQVMLSCEAAAEKLEAYSEEMKGQLRKQEWLEDSGCGWYNGYYDNHGRKVEGMFPSGARMMLTGQVFSVMSGTATAEQTEDIIKAADRYLYEESCGGYKLNTDFGEVKDDLGRMFGFAYGHKENGAVFSHMAVMYANALYGRGFAREGYKALDALYRQSADFNVSKIYPGVPEYFNDRGRGMYHYLTGSASWMMLTAVTEMYGVKGRLGDLCLEPKLMASQFDADGNASIDITFAGRQLNICYQNAARREYGDYAPRELYADGKLIEECQENEAVVIERAFLEKMDTDSKHKILLIID